MDSLEVYIRDKELAIKLVEIADRKENYDIEVIITDYKKALKAIKES